MTDKYFVESAYFQISKQGQQVPGDKFLSSKSPTDNRIVAVLADGLGSGIKANVLATLTTSMALRFIESRMDIRKASEVILSTLPICSQRKIGYSTFTIIDIEPNGEVRVIEYDNPSYIVVRNNQVINQEKEVITIELSNNVRNKLLYSSFHLQHGDRIVFFSDGVSQSGLGRPVSPFGWEEPELEDFITGLCREDVAISAMNLAREVVKESQRRDNQQAKDDITCGVFYLREPRNTLLLTGPPYQEKSDADYARIARDFEGKRIIAGGTSANIVSRELGIPLKVDLNNFWTGSKVPPKAIMEGFELITEGTITLSQVYSILKENDNNEHFGDNSAYEMADILLNSDVIRIVAGTKINEAHQDPNLPQELDIRRNLIKNIAKVLRTKFVKNVIVEFY
jgi:hypothetical protein